jgi:hypothetical protein
MNSCLSAGTANTSPVPKISLQGGIENGSADVLHMVDQDAVCVLPS